MADATAADRRVVCVTATRGELGVLDPTRWPAVGLAEIRARELTARLAVVGVHEHRWLGYAGGGCAAAAEGQAIGALDTVLDEVRPDTVLIFGPDGGTCHPDHIAVSRWTTDAVRRRGGAIRLLWSTQDAGVECPAGRGHAVRPGLDGPGSGAAGE